ncbi:MAG: DJ-1/PfpI family protein [Pseudomonadota bacterium]|nr:DJ-1/PfpI family protein [Pseudomonadota bacterium]
MVVTRRTFAQLAASAVTAGIAPRSFGSTSDAPFDTLRDKRLNIGCLLFPGMDQIDFTGPFSVLSRLPQAQIHVLAKDLNPVRDHKGLLLTPDTTLSAAPPLDLLLVTGGPGQEAMMDDAAVLSLIRNHMQAAKPLFSVCTGALICGAAGVLRGRRATTHWAAFDLLRYFGADPVDARVVVDGNLVSAAGITAGIDGALTVASLLRGQDVAQQIQLDIQYAPEPPFNAGSPHTAPGHVVGAVTARYRSLSDARHVTAKRVAQRLGVPSLDR